MGTKQSLREGLECTSTLRVKSYHLLKELSTGINICSGALKELPYLRDIYNLKETPKNAEHRKLLSRLKMLENDILLIKTDVTDLLQDLVP